VADASNAANVVVVVKEAFTSRQFVNNAKSYSFIKEQVKSHAQLYTNLQEPFNTTTFSALFQNVQAYSLQSVDELTTLVGQLSADLTASTQAQNVVLVVIKESVDNSKIDTIVELVQTAATQVNSNTLMVLTGNEGTSGTALFSLLQSDSRMLQAVSQDSNGTVTPVTIVGWAPTDPAASIAAFLNPSVLSALLISLFIFSILIFGYLQLMYV